MSLMTAQSFPLVFPVAYDFSPETTALIYLGAVPAGVLAVGLHSIYIKRVLPRLQDRTVGDLENHLVLGMIFSWLIPGGLFLYGQWEDLWHPSDCSFADSPLSLVCSPVCTLDCSNARLRNPDVRDVLRHAKHLLIHPDDLPAICR